MSIDVLGSLGLIEGFLCPEKLPLFLKTFISESFIAWVSIIFFIKALTTASSSPSYTSNCPKMSSPTLWPKLGWFLLPSPVSPEFKYFWRNVSLSSYHFSCAAVSIPDESLSALEIKKILYCTTQESDTFPWVSESIDMAHRCYIVRLFMRWNAEF